MRPSSRALCRPRGDARDLAAEARRMVDWYRQIAEDARNTVQALVASSPRPRRPKAVEAQIEALMVCQGRAYLMVERYRKQAERYERYAGIGPSRSAIGVPA